MLKYVTSAFVLSVGDMPMQRQYPQVEILCSLIFGLSFTGLPQPAPCNSERDCEL